MSIKVDKILGHLREADVSLIYEGSKNNNTTNSYLKTGEVFSNVSPILITEDCILKSISATTDGAETWSAEVHGNGSLIAGASLSITASDNESVSNLSINILAGTKISLFCNGTLIKRPRIIIELIK